MIKNVLLFIALASTLSAKNIITPNEVFSQVILIQNEVHSLLKYYKIKHNHEKIINTDIIKIPLKPRNVWQKTYEIMVKINMLREKYNLPKIQPINMSPVAHLNPDLVYEQTQRVLTELRIYKTRHNIKQIHYEPKVFKNKTPLDVFNTLNGISLTLDELNQNKVTPSYVFGENMRVFDDISLILDTLNITDKTIPAKKNLFSTPNDTAHTALNILEKIKQLQVLSGIDFVDFSYFDKKLYTPSDVFSLTQMIIAELQTIKAYLHIPDITPAASTYTGKTPAEVDQLMSWNLRKLQLITILNRKQ
jgi:hypothetical protein